MNNDISHTRSTSSPGKKQHISCVVCGGELTGKQTKFCSRKCKGRFGNNKLCSNCHAEYVAATSVEPGALTD